MLTMASMCHGRGQGWNAVGEPGQRGIGVMRDEAMRACEAVQDTSEGFVSLRFGNEPVTLGGEA